MIRRWNGEAVEGDYNPDPLWQIVQKTARSRGIDISDETSTLVRRLRIAAADDSPEKWMRFCENLLLTAGSISLTDRYIEYELGIHTSSNKIAHCTLYKLHFEGVSAEQAFAALKTNSCDQCASRVPRPADWEYSSEERARLKIKFHNFVRSATLEGFGPKLTFIDDLDL